MLVYFFITKSLNRNYYYRPYETFQNKKTSNKPEFKFKIYFNEIAFCNKLCILQVDALRCETVL